MIKIAILGYGTIGSGVVEVLNTNQESIAKRAGDEIQVKYILDLRDFPGDPMEDKVVHDYILLQMTRKSRWWWRPWAAWSQHIRL